MPRSLPGNPVGQLDVNGNLMLNATSTLSFEIGGIIPATQYDVLNKVDAGTLTLGGILNVRLINGFTPLPIDVFTIVTTQTTLAGSFSNVSNGGRLQTEDGSGSFIVTTSVLNNALLSRDVILSNFEPAPTPTPAPTPVATPTPNA